MRSLKFTHIPYIDVYIYVCVLVRIKPFMISSATGPSYNLPYKIIYHIVDYLVGLNHLEKISQWEGLSHILWKIKHV